MIYDLDKLKGQVLGQYELAGLLGTGGMGAVYRGYQQTLQREVAVKVIYALQGQNPLHEERFLREARTAAALEHAHIVPVYDFGTDQGISYVVMRLLSGGSLSQLIDDSMPRMSLAQVATITTNLASALQYAHDRNVIHRDIKASNVMFDDHGTVFLVDFGVAKMMSGTGTSLTGSGFKVGTPAFMAPEQWRNEEITPAVDQYALAILVYHMLTGQLPFRGELPYQLMHSHLNEPPDPLFRWRSDLPDTLLMPVLDRAMRKAPAQRYPDVATFAHAFHDAAQQGHALNLSASPPPSTNSDHTLNLSEADATRVLPPPTGPAQLAKAPSRLKPAVLIALLLAAALILVLLAANAAPPDLAAVEAQSPTATDVAALLLAPSATHTPSPTATDTAVPSPTASDTAVPSPTHTDTPVPTATATETPSPTPSPTAQAVALAPEPAIFTLPLTTMQSGEHAIVDMLVDCPLDYCSTLALVIEFDPAIIQIESVSAANSNFAFVSPETSRVDNQRGRIRLIAAALDPNQVATQIAAHATQAAATGTPFIDDEPVIEIEVLALQEGTSPLRVEQLDVLDESGAALRALSIDGEIFVSGTASGETCAYRVRTGDTLSDIAAANGVTVAAINALNEIPNQSIIRVGQDLRIPSGTCRAPSSTSTNGPSQVFQVYDCRNLGNNIFEWYSVRVEYDDAGEPISETRVAGPFSGAWQPGCPSEYAPAGSASNGSTGNTSSNNNSSSGNPPGGETGGGGEEEEDEGGLLEDVICILLC